MATDHYAQGRTVKTAIVAYYVAEGEYPTAANSIGRSGRRFVPGYLEEPPVLLAINYGLHPDATPTFSWTGACLAVDGLTPSP